MSEPGQFADAVIACAALVGRAGASEFEIGHTGDDDSPGRWYAHAKYKGARIQATDHADPTAAAMALAVRLLSGAICRCTRLVALNGDASADHCRWRLVGQAWEPGCDVPPLRVDGSTGDVEAMRRAMSERKAMLGEAPDAA